MWAHTRTNLDDLLGDILAERACARQAASLSRPADLHTAMRIAPSSRNRYVMMTMVMMTMMMTNDDDVDVDDVHDVHDEPIVIMALNVQGARVDET